MPSLLQQPVLDDQMPIVDVDDTTDLGVVARDDLEPLHRPILSVANDFRLPRADLDVTGMRAFGYALQHEKKRC
jgi:hypothetical protein